MFSTDLLIFNTNSDNLLPLLGYLRKGKIWKISEIFILDTLSCSVKIKFIICYHNYYNLLFINQLILNKLYRQDGHTYMNVCLS